MLNLLYLLNERWEYLNLKMILFVVCLKCVHMINLSNKHTYLSKIKIKKINVNIIILI